LFDAWIGAAGLDAVYLAFAPAPGRFAVLVEGLRGVALGFNVTAPYKEEALELADRVSDRARRAGAANLLIFEVNGQVSADNTDGAGLLAALASAPGGFEPTAGPAVIFGAGGAAQGAAAALLDVGCPDLRIVGRDQESAKLIAARLGHGVRLFSWEGAAQALEGTQVVIHATPQGQGGGEGPLIPLEAAPDGAVVVDMVYRPPMTALLARAAQLGRPTVDGLAMLIGQAVPSFEAFFGASPPAVDVRAAALEAIERSG
jgi:shikimate dehydrogenase